MGSLILDELEEMSDPVRLAGNCVCRPIVMATPGFARKLYSKRILCRRAGRLRVVANIAVRGSAASRHRSQHLNIAIHVRGGQYVQYDEILEILNTGPQIASSNGRH